jgi:hypothetical protein
MELTLPAIASETGDSNAAPVITLVDGLDGDVAGPDRRLWHVDTTDMEVSQPCGLGCLPSAPDFIGGTDGKIAQE